MKIQEFLDGKDYVILDNFLSDELVNKVYKQLTASDFPYYFSEKTLAKSIKDSYFNKGIRTTEDDRVLEYCMFNHYFYDTSSTTKELSGFNIANDMLDFMIRKFDLTDLVIYKVKANLTTQALNATKDNFAEPHIDIRDSKHIGLIYYVNDSDGDTFLFDDKLNIKERVTPKKGRVLIFNGHILHSAGHPINNSKRIVINFDFKNDD